LSIGYCLPCLRQCHGEFFVLPCSLILLPVTAVPGFLLIWLIYSYTNRSPTNPKLQARFIDL